MKLFMTAAVLAIGATAIGCGTQDPGDPEQETPSRLPKVDDSRDDLILTWFASGGPQTGSSVADVPDEYRSRVRIQDPTIPPEETDPSFVFIGDLNRPGQGGTYPVKAISRDDYEKERRAAREAVATSGPLANAIPGGIKLGPDGKPPVILYSTTTCPVCISARRWLIDKGIPYTEKDVGKDAAAAAELRAKGQAQGVPTTGVPVFDVGGLLIPGFDKDLIQKLLTSAPSAPKVPSTVSPPPGFPQPPPDKPLAPRPGPPLPPVPPDPPVDNAAPLTVDKKGDMKNMVPMKPTQLAI